MAPVIDAFTLHPPPPATMSTPLASPADPSNSFVHITLGRYSTSLDLLVPAAPPVQASADLKARCFDYLADTLIEHSSLYSSAELIGAFKHIPGSSYNANLEATAICARIKSAVFNIANLTGLGFFSDKGQPITDPITNNIPSRPAGVSYFAFRSTVNPSDVDSRITLPSFTLDFWLALPQTLHSTHSANRTAHSPTARNLSTTFANPVHTPDHPPVPPRKPRVSLAQFRAMSGSAKNKIGTENGTDTMDDYCPITRTMLYGKQLKRLVMRTELQDLNAFINPNILSPRMNTLLSPSGFADAHFTYHGPLDFLDSQTSFDSLFSPPAPVRLTVASTGVPTLDSISAARAITAFVDNCKFRIFIPIFRSDYVGTADRNDAASLHATVQALKKLSMSSRHPTSGSWINLSPDELFAEYNILTPLLPADVSLWGLNLVSQYHDSLSADLQELILGDPSYSPPNLSTLTDRSSQLAALRTLRVCAVRHYTVMKAHEKIVHRVVTRKLKDTPSSRTSSAPFSVIIPPARSDPTAPPQSGNSLDGISALTRSFLSPAEHTMQRYQPTLNTSTPFPIDPLTNFQSPFPTGFQGCMCCGSTEHVFRSCPRNGTDGASVLFYKNLFAHKPHLRK